MKDPQGLDKNIKKVNVIMTARELAEMFQEDGSLAEQEVMDRGNELLNLVMNKSVGGSFKDLNKMLISAIKLAIDDLSCGGKAMQRSTFGLCVLNGRLQTFIEPIGSKPAGEVIYSIGFKEIFPDKNWRTNDALEIPQDDLNAAIYRLAWSWGELMPPSTK